MDRLSFPQPEGTQGSLSRRRLLHQAAAGGALAAGTIALGATSHAQTPPAQGRVAASGAGDLRPGPAAAALLAAMRRFPLVAISERHMLQEWHDMITALLWHPALPGMVDDIVVEFGNAAYQDLADRFVLDHQPIARADLVQIWRQIGDPAWNAPVYEQFFRTVRAVNALLPTARRIRVLLGQPPVTMDQVIAHPTDRHLVATFAAPLDDHLAAVVEREVLRKGRRALLIAGGGHTLRGLARNDDPHKLNAASQLAMRHPGTLYVVDLLLLPPGPQQDALTHRVQTMVARWPYPVVAPLAGTWLGALTRGSPPWINEMADRATTAAGARYAAQADAVLYLGPGEDLTASQPDPAIYQWGTYPRQVRRAGALAGAGDQVAVGLHWAQARPSWFSLWG